MANKWFLLTKTYEQYVCLSHLTLLFIVAHQGVCDLGTILKCEYSRMLFAPSTHEVREYKHFMSVPIIHLVILAMRAMGTLSRICDCRPARCKFILHHTERSR